MFYNEVKHDTLTLRGGLSAKPVLDLIPSIDVLKTRVLFV